MPLQETLDTFTYFISEADKLNLSYICITRHSPFLDPTGRGTNHDVVASYGHLIKNSKRFYNAGYTAEEAAALVSEGKADAIVFGMPFISHPDFAKRVQHGKPLDSQIDWKTVYGAGLSIEEERKGYSDYPAAEY